jgi:NADH dehydrogenase
MPTRVFITGGSGFVGSAVVEELRRRGHEVVALAHHGDVPGARVVRGDVLDPRVLAEGLAGCSAAIHLIGIIAERPREGVTFRRMHVEATRAVVDAATAAGVGRYIHMSALGARAAGESEYHKTKWEAEEYVRASRLEWTIFRPSMIHGPRGEFMRMEAGWARGAKAPYFFMPYFGGGPLGRSGAGLLQPVYVDDVARAFADALDRPQTARRSYDLGGPKQMTWRDLHATASRAIVGRRRPAVAIPAWYAMLLTRLVPRPLLPFNRDQVVMSQEDNTCDLGPFRRDFGWEPADFETTLNAYAPQL